MGKRSGATIFPSENFGTNSLEKTLHPLWILTSKTGILLDWLHNPIKRENVIISTIRYLSITAVFLLLSFIMVFELLQLFFGIGTMDRMHSIVLNLIWLSVTPLPVMTMLCYIFNRKAYITFFQDWARLEPKICNSRNIHHFIYFGYILIATASSISFIVDICYHPNGSYLISSYPILIKNLKFPTLAIIHIIAVIFQWIFFSLNDLVPAFVFYHQSLALKRIEKDLISIFFRLVPSENVPNKNNTPFIGSKITITEEKKELMSVRHLWTRFENVALMVGRANQLFGRLILVGHASILFMICILFYESLYHLTYDFTSVNYGPVKMSSFLTNLIAYTFRLTSCTLLAARVQQNSLRIRNTMTWHLSQYLDLIPIKDRDVLILFNSRLQQRDTLAASPLDLYNINSSILLSIMGIIGSYVAILLQSK